MPNLINWTGLFLFKGLLDAICIIFIQILTTFYVSQQWRR